LQVKHETVAAATFKEDNAALNNNQRNQPDVADLAISGFQPSRPKKHKSLVLIVPRTKTRVCFQTDDEIDDC